ncbi:hypothetical protein N7504_006303 [Penicillium tannophilum]|nr:hypothetical protein N7504_006303 [Penicillium tannophilum]
MPGQKSLAMPEIDRSKLPAFPPKHSFTAQNVNIPPEAPAKTHTICKPDYLQSEKEDAVN